MTWIVSDRYPMAGGLVLATPMVLAEDWAGVHNAPELRGEDFVATGVAGEVFQPRVAGASRLAVRLTITGAVDDDGDPVEVPDVGLRTAIAVLVAAVTTTTATKEFRDVFSDGSYLAAQCVMSLGPCRPLDDYTVAAVLDVKNLSGIWTLTAAP
ncbi:MAG TPA: hypothetical protein VGA36_03150 [Nitriliruptorales bacterium]